MSDPIRPDHTEGAGEGAQAAPGALAGIKGGDLSILVQSSSDAGGGAVSLLAVAAEDGNGCQVLHIMDIDVPLAVMLHLAGRLTGAAANAPIDINVNRHFIPAGYDAL
jgi:hypothetical protein